MPRLRKDQAPAGEKDRFSVLAPVEVIEALNRMADIKGITRNALIVQLLSKAMAPRTKKRKGE